MRVEGIALRGAGRLAGWTAGVLVALSLLAAGAPAPAGAVIARNQVGT